MSEEVVSYKKQSDIPTVTEIYDRIGNLLTVDSWKDLQPPIKSFISDAKAIQREIIDYLSTAALSEPGEVVLGGLRTYQVQLGGLLGLASTLEDKIIGITATKIEAGEDKVTQAAKDKLGKDRAAVVKGFEVALGILADNLKSHIITTQQLYRS